MPAQAIPSVSRLPDDAKVADSSIVSAATWSRDALRTEVKVDAGDVATLQRVGFQTLPGLAVKPAPLR